jgi:hypothetical protein
LFSLGLGLVGRADHLHLLSWVEGDLDEDRVPERVLLVSPDSADPTQAKSRKKLLVLQRKGQQYRKVYEWSVTDGVPFQTKVDSRMFDGWADFWGLSYHRKTASRSARVKLCFTPGGGEFVDLMHDQKGFFVVGSGD